MTFHLLLGVAVALYRSVPTERARFVGSESIELTVAMPQIVEHTPPVAIDYETQLSTNEVLISPRRAIVAKSQYVLVPHDQGELPAQQTVSEAATLSTLQKMAPPQIQEQPVANPPRTQRIRKPTIATTAALPKSLGHVGKTPPDFSRNPPPRYPAIAVQRGWQGVVYLRVHIQADGRVASVEVIQSSGHGVLDAAAANAVKRWRAVPAKRGNRAVPTTEVLPVRFRR